MFQEVRQAVAYLLNRNEFCQQFTGGYGVVVDGPYSPDFTMWKAVQDEIELIDYSYSPAAGFTTLRASPMWQAPLVWTLSATRS